MPNTLAAGWRTFWDEVGAMHGWRRWVGWSLANVALGIWCLILRGLIRWGMS